LHDFAVPQQERANARAGQGYLLRETGSCEWTDINQQTDSPERNTSLT
jgi:hypothetical protein